MTQLRGIIATDMDGTLLTPNGDIPPTFWELTHELHAEGWVVVPASGRQLQTLSAQFDQLDELNIIAENGAVVAHNGQIISTTSLDVRAAAAVVDAFNELEAPGGVVVCRPDAAFTAHTDQDFLANCQPYYQALHQVDDINAYLDDSVVKIAIYSNIPVEQRIASTLVDIAEPALKMAISGQHWIDFMNPQVNKGKALRALATKLEVDIANTIAFGDFLNDYELLETAGTAYAMDNAHPKLKAIADEVIGSNEQHAVITTLQQLLTP
ncbi:MAG: HAD family hydrolase [Corynebacterium sp.]|nr:HAD family hydrolase [Corynebacterium sp.]